MSWVSFGLWEVLEAHEKKTQDANTEKFPKELFEFPEL